MSDCEHTLRVGTTMYVGKHWNCANCGQEMKCIDFGEHREVNDE